MSSLKIILLGGLTGSPRLALMASLTRPNEDNEMTYDVEYTDTFGGEANYSWVRRAQVEMPELTHYGYDGGSNYAKANKIYQRELMRRAKAAMGLTGERGVTISYGDGYEFRPYGACVVMFVQANYDV